MRVAMYYNNRDVRLEEMPSPMAGPGEITVRVIASGICGSDVLEWYRVKKAPIVLGHEIAGEIAEIGEGVSGWAPGDRVFVSHHVPCNTCRYCQAGNHTVCETLQSTNFAPGGFSEYLRVPPINVDRGVLRLPEEESFEDATFIEPLACVLRGQRHVRLQQGQTVLVMGSGISGLLHIMLARASGAGKIIATDVNEFRLTKAREFGADATIHAKEDVSSLLLEHNDGRAADLVIVCTGAYPAFQQAMKCVDRAGTILCFATTEPGTDLPVPINEFWRNSITVTSSYAGSPQDLAVAMEMIRLKRVDVSRMISHRLGLADAAEGFRLTAAGGASLKVIINPQD